MFHLGNRGRIAAKNLRNGRLLERALLTAGSIRGCGTFSSARGPIRRFVSGRRKPATTRNQAQVFGGRQICGDGQRNPGSVGDKHGMGNGIERRRKPLKLRQSRTGAKRLSGLPLGKLRRGYQTPST